MKVVFIGAAGSGKSTLASRVYSELKQAGRRAEHVHEFVRYDIHANGPMTSIWEQYRTRQYQKELEDAVPNVADYVICDSGTLTPYFYAVMYADPTDPRQRLVLQDMYKYLLDDLYLQRYDMIFYLPVIGRADITDGTRYQTDSQIRVLDQHMCLLFTKLHRLSNVYVVNSAFENRYDEVMWKILGVEKLTLTPRFDTMDLQTTQVSDLDYV